MSSSTASKQRLHSGVDIEPSLTTHPIDNVTFRNCTAINNSGHGFTVALYQMNGKLPVSVRFENCSVQGGRSSGFEIQALLPKLTAGSITVDGGSVEGTREFGVMISNKAMSSVPVTIAGLHLRNTATISPAAFAEQTHGKTIPFGVVPNPMAILYRPFDEVTSYTQGNIVLEDVVVEDDMKRPWLQLVAEKHGMAQITGSARVENAKGCFILRRNTTAASTGIHTTCLKSDDGSLPPHLDGIFASLGSTDDSRNASLTEVGPASWNRTAWQREIEAMKALGMTFVVVPHLAHSITTTVTSSCPSGVYGECSLAVTGAAALTADVAANRGVL